MVRFCYHQVSDKSNENTVLTVLILRLIRARKTSMGTYMSLFSGISPQMLAARVAYMAQVSTARLSQLPHLVLHSLTLADIAGRGLTKSHNNCVCISRGRPEAVLFMLKYGRGFASLFFFFFPLLYAILNHKSSLIRWRAIFFNCPQKYRSSLWYDGCE